MPLDFEGSYIERSALVIMHYQADVFTSVTWASDADYDVRLVKDCCYDPDQAVHEALFRSGFGGRVQVI